MVNGQRRCMRAIANKRGSVHMEPVPVVPWAPADILRKLHPLQSLLAAREHQMALTKAMTMLKSLLPVPVLHTHPTFQFHHRHCCLRPPVVRSVGCLPYVADCRQKFVPTVHARCKLIDASFDALVFFARRIWWPCVFTGKFQYLLILLLLPLLPNSVTCKTHGIHYPQFPLLVNSTPFTAKINYLQIQHPPPS